MIFKLQSLHLMTNAEILFLCQYTKSMGNYIILCRKSLAVKIKICKITDTNRISHDGCCPYFSLEDHLDLGPLTPAENFHLVPTLAAPRHLLGRCLAGARRCLQHHRLVCLNSGASFNCNFSAAIWVPGSLSPCWYTNTSKEALQNSEPSLFFSQISRSEQFFLIYRGFLAHSFVLLCVAFSSRLRDIFLLERNEIIQVMVFLNPLGLTYHLHLSS